LKAFTLIIALFFIWFAGRSQSYEWKWAKGTSVGLLGSGTAKANAVCYAKDSNYVFVGGQASGTSLTIVGPLLTLLGGNGQEAFIAKYTNTGILKWAIAFGASGTDMVTAIDEDDAGNIIIGGSYTSATSITGTNNAVFNLPTPAGSFDVFVIKLNHLGEVQWVQTGRSTGNVYIHDIETYNNIIYIAGEYSSSFSVGPTVSPTSVNNAGSSDAFAWSILANGNHNWIRVAQSSQNDAYLAVTAMSSGISFGGYFSGSSINFPIAGSSSSNTNTGTDEGLLVRYSATGSYLGHAQITGAGNARVNDMTNNGTDIFYTGYFNGNNIGFPGQSTFNFTNTNSFIAKCNNNSSFSTQWLRYALISDNSKGVALDVIGTAHVIGVTSYTGSLFPFNSNGGEDILTYVMNQSNGSTVSVQTNGGTNNDAALDISAKNLSNIFVVGYYGYNCNFPPQPDLNSYSSLNAFWAKYGCGGGNATISGNTTICQEDSATLNVSFSGGSPYSFTYTDGTTTSTISGISSSIYTFKVAPSTTKTYTIISSTSSSSCENTNLGSATVTVIPKISDNNIISPNSVCLTSGTHVIDGNVPNNGGGGYVYQWEYSQNGGAFASVGPLAVNEDYTAGVLSLVTKYRRGVKTSTCKNFVYSDTVEIDAPMTGNYITTGNQTLCSGTPITLMAGIPTNGGTYTYLWEKSTDGVSWISADLPNTNQNYSVVESIGTTYYRRIAKSGKCLGSPSDSVMITYEANISNNNIFAKDTVICSNIQSDSILGSTIVGGNGTPLYLWQQKSLLSSTWLAASGTNNLKNYVPGFLTQSTVFRRRVVAGVCDTSYSNLDTIVVQAPISGNSILTPDQHICETTIPDTIFATVPTGGMTPYSYSWEISTISSPTWNPLVGSLPYFVPGILTETSSYRRIVSGGVCVSSISDTHTIQVDALILNNSIAGPSTVCYSPSMILDGSTATGGNGTNNYVWQYSLTGTGFTNTGPIQTTEDIQLSNIPSSAIYYRRKDSSGVCPVSYSDTVFVDIPVTNNSISANQTICSIDLPGQLTGPTPITGAIPSYKWEQSTDGIVWNNITGVNDSVQNLQPPLLLNSRYFRRKVTTEGCGEVISNSVLISVQRPVTNNTISSGGQTICTGSSADSIIGSNPMNGTGVPYTYLWQQKNLASPNWVNANGVNTNKSYYPGILTESTIFRRVIPAAYCDSSFSNLDTIFVQTSISNNHVLSADQHLCETTIPDTIFASQATGLIQPYSFSWFKSTVTNPTLNTIVSDTNFLVPGLLTETTYFIREFKDSVCGASVSDTHTIVVDSLILNNSISGPNVICYSSPTNLDGSQPTGGDLSGFTYSWEYTTDLGIAFQNFLPNQNNEDLILNSLSQSRYIRRMVSSGLCNSTYSDTVLVHVPNSGNTIITPDQAICSTTIPDTIFASVPTGGTLNYIYLWQDSTAGNNWANATGIMVDSANYFPGMLSENTYYRRLVLDSICGNDTSSIHVIQVDNPVIGNTIGSDTTICFQTQPNTLLGSTVSNGYGYSWEETTSVATMPWTTVSGATNTNYQPGSLSDTTYFRRIVDAGNCPDNISNLVTINVSEPIGNNSISSDTMVCSGSVAIDLFGSVISGGVGNNTITWESSLDNISFNPASGTNDQANYTTGVLNQSTYFRRRVVNNVCPSQDSLSDIVYIVVYQPVFASFDFDKDSICDGQDITVPLTISGSSPLSIYMTYDGQAQNIIGANAPNANLNFTPNTSALLFLDSIVDVHGCQTTVSDTFEIRVVDQPQTNLFSDLVICDSVFLFDPTLSFGDAELYSPTLGSLSTVFPYSYETTQFEKLEFILKETNEFCVDSDTMFIAFDRPIGTVSAGQDQIIDETNETYLDASDLVGSEVGYWTLLSSNGYIVTPDDPNTFVQDLTLGKTYFIWTVSNGVCPQKSDTVQILLRDILIPSGFSPNGDGSNDLFFIRGISKYNDIKLQVFNRWGNQVYSSSDYKNDWDGKLPSGEDLPDDTYFYILDLTETEMFKGYLVIKR
jgi:gliding motility-associated-like protein